MAKAKGTKAEWLFRGRVDNMSNAITGRPVMGRKFECSNCGYKSIFEDSFTPFAQCPSCSYNMTVNMNTEEG